MNPDFLAAPVPPSAWIDPRWPAAQIEAMYFVIERLELRGVRELSIEHGATIKCLPADLQDLFHDPDDASWMMAILQLATILLTRPTMTGSDADDVIQEALTCWRDAQ